MMWLEREGEPPRGGFSGEKGLAYAWVLARSKYYRHALEQIDGLHRTRDPVVDSAAFQLVAGHVYVKRRRYDNAFRAYARAAELLDAQPPPASPVPSDPPPEASRDPR